MFIAHRRQSDGQEQSLAEHLIGVSALAQKNAAKLGLGSAGALIGLLHDLGKYSRQFHQYLLSAQGLIDSDADGYVDARALKGKIDHSTAGAQYLWNHLSPQGGWGVFTGQLLALCIASHHSGLIDCISASAGTCGEDLFTRRMHKGDEKTNLGEVVTAADREVLEGAAELLKDPDLVDGIRSLTTSIAAAKERKSIPHQMGLMARFLFSCLIDADRTDTADFEHRRVKASRLRGNYTNWETLSERLESYLAQWEPSRPIDALRREISQKCLLAAARPKGAFTLTVPTGGGKTLSSLRFALHHAKQHGLDRIIYVIPFTSIIDQNAEVLRRILETAPQDRGQIVLEHHSNLTPQQQTWREKILCENWDAPIVCTTMVQFLESLFGRGTRGARRMHQLANALVIFDEIQTLPIKCVHLFNNAINLLIDQAKSTVVLCTATQPLLDQVSKEDGALRLSPGHELVEDKHKLFDSLQRVDVHDHRKSGGWSYGEVAQFAIKERQRQGSCLVIVNTKEAARSVYAQCRELPDAERFHLSTNMCAAHRKQQFQQIRTRLESGLPVLCVSTQLIEAGVDIDFRTVIRFLAGMDSIAQAAGRCNRHGGAERGTVYIVNSLEERLSSLPDITTAAEISRRILDTYKDDQPRYRHNLVGPEAIEDYFKHYFFERQKEMVYRVEAGKDGDLGHDDTLLNLLSANRAAVSAYQRRTGANPPLHFLQAFMTAANAFESIDAPTRGVIVPFGPEGDELIGQLCGAFEVEKQYELLKGTQQFTVNVFPHVLKELDKKGAVHRIQEDVDILYLDKVFYDDCYGLTTEAIANMERLDV